MRPTKLNRKRILILVTIGLIAILLTLMQGPSALAKPGHATQGSKPTEGDLDDYPSHPELSESQLPAVPVENPRNPAR